MTVPKLDTKVSIGNIVSWTMIVISIIVGYVKMSDAQAQTAKEVAVALQRSEATMTMIQKNREDAQASDTIITAKVADLSTDVAVIKKTTESMETMLREMHSNHK